MKRIPLTKGKFALVDDDDYPWLMQWHWQVMGPNPSNGEYYAWRYSHTDEQGKSVRVKMQYEVPREASRLADRPQESPPAGQQKMQPEMGHERTEYGQSKVARSEVRISWSS